MSKTIGVVVVLLISLVGAGCASKKFVMTKLNPLHKRVDKLESDAKSTSERVDANRDAASRAEEVARGAQDKADEAGSAANRATGAAGEASSLAADARTLAENNQSALGDIDQKIDSLDDFELVVTETIFFPLESSRLADEAKQKLDAAVNLAPANKPFVIEVRGFTDKTGSLSYNLALSEGRASAVARYLSNEHGIPLRRIHMLGMGSDGPAADNGTRRGRRQNRRVELKLYSLKLATTARHFE